jgi:hypothetical protein
MNTDDLDSIIKRQSDLIAALDAQDASAITHATEALAAAMTLSKSRPLQRGFEPPTERVTKALQQAKSASIRINYLLNWTRQRIGKIAELRGQPMNGYNSSY